MSETESKAISGNVAQSTIDDLRSQLATLTAENEALKGRYEGAKKTIRTYRSRGHLPGVKIEVLAELKEAAESQVRELEESARAQIKLCSMCCNGESRAEVKRLRGQMQFLADQDCDHLAPSSSSDCICRETDDCVTEWCASCYTAALLTPTPETGSDPCAECSASIDPDACLTCPEPGKSEGVYP